MHIFMEDIMSEQADVCYTFEGALEMAISMETEGFRNYLEAIRRVKSRSAKAILKDAALDELAHKYDLEKALVDGHISEGTLHEPLPTMQLGSVIVKKELRPDSDAREALAYSIHLENEAIAFYQKMTNACAGAPMGTLIARLLADESRHLQQLEDLYEQHFMTEN